MLNLKNQTLLKAATDKTKPILKIQPPPLTIKLELTKGCNLHCSFCAIKTIQKKPGKYEFLSQHTVNKLVYDLKQLNWKPRIECGMRGEPLLNPKYNYILKKLRMATPSILVYSNGIILTIGDTTKIIDTLMENITTLCLEDYDHSTALATIKKKYKGKFEFIPFKDSQIYTKSKKQKSIIVLPDVFHSQIIKSRTRKISNMGGFAGKLNFSKLNKVCTNPFRELVILYNGDVSLCCVDWPGKFIIGNIHTQSIDAIWNSRLMLAARKILYNYGRVFAPCYGCDRTCFYSGLIPTGSKPMMRMGPVNQKDIDLIQPLSLQYNRFNHGYIH